LKKASYISIFLFLTSFFAHAQLVTNVGMSPADLVQNVLLGQGVTVSNIMYSGSPSAIGSFSAQGTNLGIAQGIILTTGTVLNNGSGPQGPNNQSGAGMDNNVGGSTMLSGIIGNVPTFNAAILEFDFIPFSDTVRFKYVFGSDEYPEFAPPNNSTYNDVFGFFISGPGFTGSQNIARLPTNQSIVSINNVNAITNPAFYRFNGDGNSAPYNSSPQYIQYDGFTRVLEAVARVQCGETYHLVIAVADVGDGMWDSGIFLEANSLSSVTPVSVTHTVSPAHYTNPDWMAEGCATATVTVRRETNLNAPFSIPVIVSGTATNGVDYTGIPNVINFAPGEQEIVFTVNALADDIQEGIETIRIVFPIADPCGNETPIEVNLFIQDVPPFSVIINNPTILCQGDNITLLATVSGGLGPFSYLWSNGATTQGISINPNQTGEYSIIVSDICNPNPVYDTVMVTVPEYAPLFLTSTADIVEQCPGITHTLSVIATGGSGLYTYTWRQNNQNIGNTPSIQVTPMGSTAYFVMVTDNCGSVAFDTIYYTILSPPLLVHVSTPAEICPGDSALITVSASGGFGNYQYVWTDNGSNSTAIWVKPNQTRWYEVKVSDDCGTFSVAGYAQVTVNRPNADFIILTNTTPMEGLPVSFQNLTQNASSYQWFFGDGGNSPLMHPSHTYQENGIYYVTLIARDAQGCTDTVVKPIKIHEEFYIYIPNTFIPDGDRFNNEFFGSFIGVESIKMEVFNRWGESLYFTNDKAFRWDGKVNGKQIQDGTYIWLLKYIPVRGVEQTMTGHVNVLR
jgi:gliding motility-associated-like protein